MKSFRIPLFAAIAAVSISIFAAAAAFAADDLAHIASINGDVEFKATFRSAWKKADSGQALTEGAQVKTGKGGEAVIKWQQGHMLKVYPLTVLTIDKMTMERRGNMETTKLNVDSGKILVRAEKLVSDASSFEIKTPTAVAGVRGTSFMMEISEDGSTTVGLLDGALDITGDMADTILESNSQIDIPADGGDPEVGNLSSDLASEIEKGLNEFDSVPASQTSSAAPAKSTSASAPSNDPAITAQDLIRTEDIVGDSLNDTIDEVLVNPSDMDIIIMDDEQQSETQIPPMPPH